MERCMDDGGELQPGTALLREEEHTAHRQACECERGQFRAVHQGDFVGA